MKVGSPPIVNRTSDACNARSTASPAASTAAHCVSVKGAVIRAGSRSRVTVMAKSKDTSAGSCAPVIAAAETGAGVAASGIWPSPANSPDVASSPIQPAPGTKASAQACRSVKSVSGPAGPSSSGFSSAASWIR